MEEYMRNIYEVYRYLQDEQSRFIYINRLNYSLTHDTAYLTNIVDNVVRNRTEWTEFYSALKELSEKHDELVVFGGGIWGNILYDETKDGVAWKCVIDNKPEGKNVGNLPVLGFVEAIENYGGEYIVVSSYKNGKSMKNQLLAAGIPKEKIIDAGAVIYELTEKAIYFDIGELMPVREKEVFVDAGCFDGLTTKRFLEWCGGNGYSYCFEPDEKNIECIDKNLKDCCQRYEIVGKALYSSSTTLAINAKGNFASSVSELKGTTDLPTIEAAALDDILREQKITFIKMDIEGSELSALHGAENIIREQKPRLAISIYHKLEDIWTIPEFIMKLNPDYKLYLRHYSFSHYDTVLYAV